MTYLCIDIGATKTLIATGFDEFRSREKYSTKKFLNDAAEIIEAKIDPQCEVVAVAVPGTLDVRKGLFFPPNIPGREVDVRSLLEPVLSEQEFILINDCTAGVAGEYYYGALRESNMAYISISTGIGAGVIVQGRLMTGHSGNFAEVGHLKVGGSLICGCGGKGHWESYCSGKNLPKFAESLTGRKFKDASDIFVKYAAGDPAATKIIEKMKEYNAAGISNVVNAYSPELIVLGGGVVVNNADVITDGLAESIRQDILPAPPRITTSSLGDDPVLYGLLALCGLHGRIGSFDHRSSIKLL